MLKLCSPSCPSLVPAQRGCQLRLTGGLQCRPADGEYWSNTGQCSQQEPHLPAAFIAVLHCVGKEGCKPGSMTGFACHEGEKQRRGFAGLRGQGRA